MADQLEGRNPILECLTRRRRRVLHIWLDARAKPDPKLDALVRLAEEQRVPIDRVDRQILDRKADGRVHNGIVAVAEALPHWTTLQLVDQVLGAGRSPFFVLADEVQYEHNLGAILRSGLGFGVDGIVVPTRRGAEVSSVVQRVAMGAAEVVPVVHESMFSAIKHIRKAGIRVVAADMDGVPLGQADLRGALALVMGGEGRGVSSTLRQHCDGVVSVPLAGGLESLNVSVAAAVLMYEKRRQDGWFQADASAQR